MEACSTTQKGMLAATGSGVVFVALALAAYFLRSPLWRLPVEPGARAADVLARSPVADQAANPTDLRMRSAQAFVERAPADPRGYTLLCAAYMQKARETGDFGMNAKAQAALDRALRIAPGDLEVLKYQALLLLTYHRFNEALDVARRAQQLRPRDDDLLGALTDALVELGDYEAAAESAQAMIDLRPDAASYARVSYQRSLRGDTAGAIAAMRLAVQAANPGNPEEGAWCRVHLGYELMNAGKLAEAEHEFDLALATFPQYHMALAAKARARAAAGDATAAIQLYQRAQDRVPLPDTVAALGDLYAKLGRSTDAERQYALLDFIGRSGAPGSATYSRQLALFWADHGMHLDEALALAQQERAARSDIYTCDTLAWCLFKKGRLDEAKAAIGDALRLGTRDARLYYHAGMIYKVLGDRAAAVRYLRLALDTNATFDLLQADVARSMLTEMGVQ